MPKIEVNAWLDADNSKFSNVPTICPKCYGKLRQIDAIKLCGILFIWCPKLTCRWCDIYTS